MLNFLLNAFKCRFDPLSKGFFVLWNNNVKGQDTQLTKPSMGFFFSTIKNLNNYSFQNLMAKHTRIKVIMKMIKLIYMKKNALNFELGHEIFEFK